VLIVMRVYGGVRSHGWRVRVGNSAESYRLCVNAGEAAQGNGIGVNRCRAVGEED
jgi:hypothetical protein